MSEKVSEKVTTEKETKPVETKPAISIKDFEKLYEEMKKYVDTKVKSLETKKEEKKVEEKKVEEKKEAVDPQKKNEKIVKPDLTETIKDESKDKSETKIFANIRSGIFT